MRAAAHCEVCAAPALPLAGACTFCRSPLEGEAGPGDLLDYLASRFPQANCRRGFLGRGHVRELRVVAGGQRFRARLGRRQRLRLEPQLEPAEWIDCLLRALSLEARRDAAVRSSLTRAGWALR